MSGQLLELIIFAAIAFFIINKLLSTLGSTSEDDPTKNKSFFGEAGGMKDVSNTRATKSTKVSRPNFNKKTKIALRGLIIKENEADIRTGINDILKKTSSFNPANFIKNSKMAFQMIIDAGAHDNEQDLEDLVDKRYLESFRSMSSNYGEYVGKKTALTGHISEIYLFGNNIFIKILFAGKNITEKVKELHEE